MTNKIVPARIVRELAGNKIMFNDRLSNGGRSIKVWGWQMADYQAAIQALVRQGVSCAIVRTPKIKGIWDRGGNLRIHTVPV